MIIARCWARTCCWKWHKGIVVTREIHQAIAHKHIDIIAVNKFTKMHHGSCFGLRALRTGVILVAYSASTLP